MEKSNYRAMNHFVAESSTKFKQGDKIQVHSYKHNGKLHRAWSDTIVLKHTLKYIIVANDNVLVTESDGNSWRTKDLAVCYFDAKHWFNVIWVSGSENYYYCNLGTPYVFENEILKYVDYDIDFKVMPNMKYTILDVEEYELHRKIMNYPDLIDKKIKASVTELTNWITNRKGPFAPQFFEFWYEQFLRYYS